MAGAFDTKSFVKRVVIFRPRGKDFPVRTNIVSLASILTNLPYLVQRRRFWRIKFMGSHISHNWIWARSDMFSSQTGVRKSLNLCYLEDYKMYETYKITLTSRIYISTFTLFSYMSRVSLQDGALIGIYNFLFPPTLSKRYIFTIYAQVCNKVTILLITITIKTNQDSTFQKIVLKWF